MSDSMEIYWDDNHNLYWGTDRKSLTVEHGYKLYTLSLKKKKGGQKGHPLGNLHELVNNTYATLSLGFLTHLFSFPHCPWLLSVSSLLVTFKWKFHLVAPGFIDLFPWPGSNPGSPHWERGVLAAGTPARSHPCWSLYSIRDLPQNVKTLPQLFRIPHLLFQCSHHVPSRSVVS